MSQGQNPEKHLHIQSETKRNSLSLKEGEKEPSESWENQEKEEPWERKKTQEGRRSGRRWPTVFIVAKQWSSLEGCQDSWLHCYELGKSHSSRQ